DATVITTDVVERAVELVDYFVGHARAAFSLAGADGPMALARDIAAWIAARHQLRFTRRDCHRAFQHRVETVADLKPVLETLIEYGYIRDGEPEPAPKPSGGRPSPSFDVNPALFS